LKKCDFLLWSKWSGQLSRQLLPSSGHLRPAALNESSGGERKEQKRDATWCREVAVRVCMTISRGFCSWMNCTGGWPTIFQAELHRAVIDEAVQTSGKVQC
jgi:hypothetical protein